MLGMQFTFFPEIKTKGFSKGERLWISERSRKDGKSESPEDRKTESRVQ
jgi:hypothetical protein